MQFCRNWAFTVVKPYIAVGGLVSTVKECPVDHSVRKWNDTDCCCNLVAFWWHFLGGMHFHEIFGCRRGRIAVFVISYYRRRQLPNNSFLYSLCVLSDTPTAAHFHFSRVHAVAIYRESRSAKIVCLGFGESLCQRWARVARFWYRHILPLLQWNALEIRI